MRPRAPRVVASLGIALAATVLFAPSLLSSGATAAVATSALCAPYRCPPPIHHAVTIVLENSDFALTYGAGSATSADPYLTGTLEHQGVLIPGYWGTGHSSLDNYIAMISGQSPNPATQDDCNDTTTMPSSAPFDKHGQVIGVGCNYPAEVTTIADQLQAAGLAWKSYNQAMDAQPNLRYTHCQNAAHGLIQTGANDPYANPKSAVSPDTYAAKHNPFVYFHSITDNLPYCEQHDVPLGAINAGGPYDPFGQLRADFAPNASPPNYAFITPDLCSDGHDSCNGSTASPQLNQIDTFLHQAIPIIETNPAFQPGGDGIIVIITDEGEGESTACCDEQPGPNLAPTSNNGNNLPPGPGGGQTGALVIAPSFVTGGRVDTAGSYNHYSYLRSMEDLFGLAHLGFAGDYKDLQRPLIDPTGGPAPFGNDVYDRAS